MSDLFPGQRQSTNVLIGRVLGQPFADNGVIPMQQYLAAQDPRNGQQMPFTVPQGPMDVAQQQQAQQAAQSFAQQLGYTPQGGNAFTQSQQSGIENMFNQSMLNALKQALEAQKQAQQNANKPLKRPGRSRWGDENMTGM